MPPEKLPRGEISYNTAARAAGYVGGMKDDPASKVPAGSTAISALLYRDAPAAIDWLCEVFGFARRMVCEGDKPGVIAHAELTLGGRGMIMLGSTGKGGEYEKHIKQPDEIGGVETQSQYLVVPDADVVYGRAKEAGAEIVIDIRDEDYGGRGFSCKDPEGHLWYVGTYDPWSAASGES